MNEKYAMMAKSYKHLMEQGKIDKNTAEKEIRVYEFLSACNGDDICRLVNSAAFNAIIRAYLQVALKNADIDEKTQDKVLSQLSWMFDEMTAKEVLNDAKKKD